MLSSFPSEDYPPKGYWTVSSETTAEIIPLLLSCATDCPKSSEILRKKFGQLQQKGGTVWFAKHQNEIIGFVWATKDNYQMPCSNKKIFIALSEKNIFLESAFVKNEYRRKGVYSKILQTLRQNFPEIIFSCVVDYDNSPSLQAHIKNGFTQTGTLWYCRFFGIVIHTTAPSTT
jgi:L-amino acid N-acyltransferase YncA